MLYPLDEPSWYASRGIDLDDHQIAARLNFLQIVCEQASLLKTKGLILITLYMPVAQWGVLESRLPIGLRFYPAIVSVIVIVKLIDHDNLQNARIKKKKESVIKKRVWL